jgi:hypothetical protein
MIVQRVHFSPGQRLGLKGWCSEVATVAAYGHNQGATGTRWMKMGLGLMGPPFQGLGCGGSVTQGVALGCPWVGPLVL